MTRKLGQQYYSYREEWEVFCREYPNLCEENLVEMYSDIKDNGSSLRREVQNAVRLPVAKDQMRAWIDRAFWLHSPPLFENLLIPLLNFKRKFGVSDRRELIQYLLSHPNIESTFSKSYNSLHVIKALKGRHLIDYERISSPFGKEHDFTCDHAFLFYLEGGLDFASFEKILDLNCQTSKKLIVEAARGFRNKEVVLRKNSSGEYNLFSARDGVEMAINILRMMLKDPDFVLSEALIEELRTRVMSSRVETVYHFFRILTDSVDTPSSDYFDFLLVWIDAALQEIENPEDHDKIGLANKKQWIDFKRLVELYTGEIRGNNIYHWVFREIQEASEASPKMFLEKMSRVEFLMQGLHKDLPVVVSRLKKNLSEVVTDEDLVTIKTTYERYRRMKG